MNRVTAGTVQDKTASLSSEFQESLLYVCIVYIALPLGD
jgi:hypothetical protein